MLFIPFFNDQLRIAKKVMNDGYGLILKFDDLTKETFTFAIEEITSNPDYKAQAEAASTLFKDNSENPMNEAMFWIEHVIRTGGAKYLKSSSVDLCWSQYMMIDVGLFYFAIFAVSFLTWVMIIKLCINRYRSKEQKAKFKYY